MGAGNLHGACETWLMKKECQSNAREKRDGNGWSLEQARSQP